MKSWLTDQFKAARQEVQSWSPGKQAMMKNAIRVKRMEYEKVHKLGDYDMWYKRCDHCGFDPAKSFSDRCWKCGRRVQRDFSKRALKRTVKQSGEVKYDD